MNILPEQSSEAYAASAEGGALIISTYEDTILRYREAKARVGDALVATVADIPYGNKNDAPRGPYLEHIFLLITQLLRGLFNIVL